MEDVKKVKNVIKLFISIFLLNGTSFYFVCAIKYGKIIGYKLYEKDKGGIDNIRQSRNLVNFIMIL